MEEDTPKGNEVNLPASSSEGVSAKCALLSLCLHRYSLLSTLISFYDQIVLF